MKNSLTRKLMSVAGALAILASSMGALAQASTLTMTGGTVGTVNTQTTTFDSIDNTYFYQNCYSPVNILLNTENTDTTSVDVKIFATGFDYQNTPSSYSGFISGSLFTTFYSFVGGVSNGAHLTTGAALSGEYETTDYFYFNAYSDYANKVTTATDTYLATVYLKPKSTETTGKLMFYYLPTENYDDSNVSSGTNTETATGYTQYVDSLTAVYGTGEYTLVNSFACPFRPYVDDGANYYFTLGTGLIDYVSGANHYTVHNSGGTVGALTLRDPTSGPYSGYITLKAGPNVTGSDFTDWYYWTNQPITVTLSGNDSQDIRILDNTLTALGTVDVTTNERANEHTITITGVVEDTLDFENKIGNTGDTYDGWTDQIEINTFFYDTTATAVTTGVTNYTGYAYAYIDGATGGSADRTDTDDIIRITKFSGTNTLNYNYPNDPTAYNEALNQLYVADAETVQTYTMAKTGILSTDPENPVATQTGGIMFTETWEGWVYYSDIAGNTGRAYFDIEVEPVATFEIIGLPAFREEAGTKILTGNLWLARDNGTAWEFLYNSELDTNHPQIELNAEGTGSVTWIVPSSGQEFLVVFKGTGMTSIGFTGEWGANTTENAVIDFTNIANNTGVSLGDIFPDIHYGGEQYIIAGDIKVDVSGAYDYINSADLALINGSLSVGVLPTSINHYDFDINNVINAIEQGIVINYNDFNGWIYEYSEFAGTHTYPASGDFTNEF